MYRNQDKPVPLRYSMSEGHELGPAGCAGEAGDGDVHFPSEAQLNYVPPAVSGREVSDR